MQNENLLAIANKYSNIAGDYAANVWEGVQHYLLDSGICTDAFSVADAERVVAAKLQEFSYDNGLQEINEAVKAADGGADLDCVQCIAAIEAEGYDAMEAL